MRRKPNDLASYLKKHRVSFRQNRKTGDIESLDLLDHIGTDAILEKLRAAKALVWISLELCDISDAGLECIASLSQVEDLTIWRCPNLTPEAFRAIEGHRGVQSVHVRDIVIDDTTLESLSKLPHLQDLELFESPKITNAGMRHVANMRSLSRLSLVANPRISDDGFAYLKNLVSLTRLSIDSEALTDKTLENVAGMKKLKYLNLADANKINGSGFRHFAMLERLEILSTRGTTCSDSCLRYLTPLRNLKQLYLDGNGITDKGLRALKGLAKLKSIELSSTNVTERGKALLKSMYPRCKVYIAQDNDDGDGIDVSQFDGEYWWRHPPRCLNRLTVTPLRKRPPTTFQIACKCGCAQGSILGYPLKESDQRSGGPELISPLKFRCKKCKKTTTIIDTAQHGYNAEIGSPDNVRGSGKHSVFSCPSCQKNVMHALVSFQYDGGELDLMQDEPTIVVEDYFASFAAYGVCADCNAETCVAALELA